MRGVMAWSWGRGSRAERRRVVRKSTKGKKQSLESGRSVSYYPHEGCKNRNRSEPAHARPFPIPSLPLLPSQPRFTVGALLKTKLINVHHPLDCFLKEIQRRSKKDILCWSGVVGHACDPISDTETQRERERERGCLLSYLLEQRQRGPTCFLGLALTFVFGLITKISATGTLPEAPAVLPLFSACFLSHH